MQFVLTSERGILVNAIEQLKKVPLKEQRGPQERLHLKSLLSRIENDKSVQEITFLQSFLLPIQKWADKQLGDYHLHYPEVNENRFKRLLCSWINNHDWHLCALLSLQKQEMII